VSDSKKVVEICTQYAQKGMFNIFLTVFFSALAFAFAEPYFFIGYLISIALFGLFQAIFMANAGGAWDNAKKIVEVELKERELRFTLQQSSEIPLAIHSRTRRRLPLTRSSSSRHCLDCSQWSWLSRFPSSAAQASLTSSRSCSLRSRWCSCGGRSTACESNRSRLKLQKTGGGFGRHPFCFISLQARNHLEH
jgi:hypothetical protein